MHWKDIKTYIPYLILNSLFRVLLLLGKDFTSSIGLFEEVEEPADGTFSLEIDCAIHNFGTAFGSDGRFRIVAWCKENMELDEEDVSLWISEESEPVSDGTSSETDWDCDNLRVGPTPDDVINSLIANKTQW